MNEGERVVQFPVARRSAWCAAVVALVLGLSACASEPPFDMTVQGGKTPLGEPTPEEVAAVEQALLAGLDRGEEAMRLRVSDELEVMFHIRPEVQETYPVAVGDAIAVDFADELGFDFTARVTPDGWISLPDAGLVSVAGRTLPDINRLVRERYQGVLREPRVSVRLDEWTTEEEAFARDVESLALGRAKRVPVQRDGRVILPLIDALPAAGRTVAELRKDIDRAYAERGLSVSSSVLLAESAGDRIFVFGEVREPGLFVTERPETALMAIARAGGVLPDGTLTDVRVLYTGRDGRRHLRKVDMESVMTDLALHNDMVLPDNSVIYVPTTRLAKTARVMDQVLGRVLQFRGFSVGAGYELNPVEPN